MKSATMNKSAYNASDLKALDSLYYRFFKPLFDRSIALLILLLVSPVMIVTALAIKLESRGPIFFKQTRAGYQGKPFVILKFRSMVVQDIDPAKQAFLDDPRCWM
jgi:putative colanic acid biosysnthesis UDP-glucose lipid carrier transferase